MYVAETDALTVPTNERHLTPLGGYLIVTSIESEFPSPALS